MHYSGSTITYLFYKNYFGCNDIATSDKHKHVTPPWIFSPNSKGKTAKKILRCKKHKQRK